MDVRCSGCGQKIGEREADGEVVIRLRMRPREYRILRDPRTVECERCGVVTDMRLPVAA